MTYYSTTTTNGFGLLLLFLLRGRKSLLLLHMLLSHRCLTCVVFGLVVRIAHFVDVDVDPAVGGADVAAVGPPVAVLAAPGCGRFHWAVLRILSSSFFFFCVGWVEC